jgi:hypothetical protein
VFALNGDYPREDASYGDSSVNYCNRGDLAIQNAGSPPPPHTLMCAETHVGFHVKCSLGLLFSDAKQN